MNKGISTETGHTAAVQPNIRHTTVHLPAQMQSQSAVKMMHHTGCKMKLAVKYITDPKKTAAITATKVNGLARNSGSGTAVTLSDCQTKLGQLH